METATNFSAIETIVHQGKAVVSSEDSAIIEWAFKTITEGRTATLYLKPTVYEAIRRRFRFPQAAGKRFPYLSNTDKVFRHTQGLISYLSRRTSCLYLSSGESR
jgi:hypothetical protein